ncbi:hypothetical protein QQS21_010883 [Conoideocrella luteorostrata]|uniref:Uncharacterized protein n=1 Tax=Conoideocrella luteorostrata TaxID=1105319 RepID=A0AAJ0FTT0_9HYPO|nr:hypothetical protein QQS21_010883 [Conoideocrella luteorostrata]
MLVNMGYPTDHNMSMRTKQKPIAARPKPKAQPYQSQPVDAGELSRRLSAVLAEQRAHSERRRRGRAEAEKLKVSTLAHRSKQSANPGSSTSVARRGYDDVSTEKAERSSPQGGSPPPRNKSKPSDTKRSSRSSHRGSEGDLDHSATYRHVPKVAASQFARTTTVESSADKGPIHKLSKKAMKFHLEGPNASLTTSVTNPDASPCEQTKALKRAQSMRERHYERNPIHEPSLPTTFELDVSIHLQGPENILQTRVKQGKGEDGAVREARRMSTGSILGRTEAPTVDPFEMTIAFLSPEKPEVIGDPNEHRVDWTQSDEVTASRFNSHLAETHHELRKPESKWTLRGRLGSFGRHGKDDKLPSPPDEAVLHDSSPKSPISGFLSRFKR